MYIRYYVGKKAWIGTIHGLAQFMDCTAQSLYLHFVRQSAVTTTIYVLCNVKSAKHRFVPIMDYVYRKSAKQGVVQSMDMCI